MFFKKLWAFTRMSFIMVGLTCCVCFVGAEAIVFGEHLYRAHLNVGHWAGYIFIFLVGGGILYLTFSGIWRAACKFVETKGSFWKCLFGAD